MPKIKIKFYEDKACDMEALYINDLCLGGGNTWDKHCDDRLDALLSTLKYLNIPFTYELITKPYAEWEFI